MPCPEQALVRAQHGVGGVRLDPRSHGIVRRGNANGILIGSIEIGRVVHHQLALMLDHARSLVPQVRDVHGTSLPFMRGRCHQHMLAYGLGQRLIQLDTVYLAGLDTVHIILTAITRIIKVILPLVTQHRTVDGRIAEIKHRLAVHIDKRPLGAVADRHPQPQTAVGAAACGVVHHKYAVVIYHLGRPEALKAPMVLPRLHTDDGIAPRDKILALPYIKALVEAGRVAIIGVLIQQDLRVTDTCDIRNDHQRSPLTSR